MILKLLLLFTNDGATEIFTGSGGGTFTSI